MQINVRSHSTLASVSSTVSCFPHKLQYPIKTARIGPLSLNGGVWWFSLVVGINLNWTGMDLRISEVAQPDKCINPETDPVLRDTSKLDTVNKFVNIRL